MSTTIGYDGKGEFVAFMIVFVIIIVAGVFGIASGKFRSTNNIDCAQYRDLKMADVPAHCVREYQR